MKKYLLLSLFLMMFVASPVLADGRGKGRGHHGRDGYKHAQKWEKQAFNKGRYGYRPRGYPVYGYYQAYPVYPAYPPPPAYGYYPACPYPPPPPAYGPSYGRRGVRGRIGVDIIF